MKKLNKDQIDFFNSQVFNILMEFTVWNETEMTMSLLRKAMEEDKSEEEKDKIREKLQSVITKIEKFNKLKQEEHEQSI